MRVPTQSIPQRNLHKRNTAFYESPRQQTPLAKNPGAISATHFVRLARKIKRRTNLRPHHFRRFAIKRIVRVERCAAAVFKELSLQSFPKLHALRRLTRINIGWQFEVVELEICQSTRRCGRPRRRRPRVTRHYGRRITGPKETG